jgi:hypothetical protein
MRLDCPTKNSKQTFAFRLAGLLTSSMRGWRSSLIACGRQLLALV